MFWVSRANMLLFLTRDAFCSFSMDDRRPGAAKGTFSLEARGMRVGEGDSRPFQKLRGEVVGAGDGSNGDESPETGDF